MIVLTTLYIVFFGYRFLLDSSPCTGFISVLIKKNNPKTSEKHLLNLNSELIASYTY